MNGNRNRTRLVAALSAGAFMIAAASAYAESDWRVIDEGRGIKVTARDEPGRDLPTLRGQGVIQGRVLDVLAVILDAPGATRWAKGADEVRVLRVVDPRTQLIYTRTDTPWPVNDRDMIMKRMVQVVKPGSEFHIRLLCAPNETAELDGIVRVKTCDSYFHIRAVDDKSTSVDYQVNLDPGGSLPDWLIRWASKKIPMETIVTLESQAKKSVGKYAAVVREWAKAK